MGTLQATEAVKSILGVGDMLTNRLLTYDALDSDFRTLTLNKRSDCAICGDNPSITELIDYEQAVCGVG